MHFLLFAYFRLQFAFLYQNLLIFLFLPLFFFTEPFKLIEHVLVLLLSLFDFQSRELISIFFIMNLIFGFRTCLYQSLLAFHHRDLCRLDVFMSLVYAFPHKELMCTEHANGASCAWLTRFGILNGPRVVPGALHALFVVRVAAKCAKDHLIRVLEYISAWWTLLDALVLIRAYWTISKEDRVLIIKFMGMSIQREILALFS